jgi:hypothetical protein
MSFENVILNDNFEQRITKNCISIKHEYCCKHL